MKNYTLCDYEECPLKDQCARYLPGLDRKEIIHFAWIPYNEGKKKCPFFEPYEDAAIDENFIENILKKIKEKDDAKDAD